MKKIIFFDGDGTLWYPKRTKYLENPWWIYDHPKRMNDPVKHLTLTPGTRTVLKKLKSMGIVLVVVSTHPQSTKAERNLWLMKKIKHLKLEGYFAEFRASRVATNKKMPNLKDKELLDVLKRRKIKKSEALMVGDSYMHDYLPAKKSGIECILIDSFRYKENYKEHSRVHKKIENLSGIFKYVN